jgi:hypothetical protein
MRYNIKRSTAFNSMVASIYTGIYRYRRIMAISRPEFNLLLPLRVAPARDLLILGITDELI